MIPVSLPCMKQRPGDVDPPLFGKEEVKQIMSDTYRQGDRIMKCAILLHCLLALCFAPVYQTWNVALLIGGAAALLFFTSVWLMPGRFITRCIAGLSLQMFTALHIYQYHGLPEMHFFFFTAFTLMIVYQDWQSMWPGTIAIITQHILFAIWTDAGHNLFFFPQAEIPIEPIKLAYHFGIALTQVGIAGVCANRLQRKRLQHAWQERRLRESGRLLEEQLQRTQDSEARLQEQASELLETRQRLERDIRERQEIEKSRAQLYAIVEATSDFIAMGDRDGKLLYRNRAWRRIRKVSDHADITAMQGGDSHTPQSLLRIRREALPTVLKEGIWKGETEMVDGDGRIIPVSQVILAHRDAAGDVEFFSTIARDISVRKKTEEELHKYTRELEIARNHAENQTQLLKSQAVELQQVRDAALASTHAKSQFLANMSHEIRTPMNGVLGMMELLRSTPLQADQRDYIDTARSSAENLLSVLNDILDFSKIEAGKLSLETIPFNLRSLMEEVTEMFAPRAYVQGLELLCLIPPELPGLLTGDPGRLRQILVNLLGNAFKFTAQGEVVLQAEVLRCSAHYATVRLLVRDTGIGIAAERQQCLFDSFMQADGSTARKYGGTGLGLSICRQLAHLMRGEIGLDSVQGVGSVFWVELTLPIAAMKQETIFSSLPVLRGLRVLIVDDNMTNRRILSEQLSQWGCLPDTAEGGKEALRMLRSARKPYQLVMLDMQMPEMDAEHVAHAMRNDALCAGIPLVLLSSIGARGTDIQIFEKEFDAVLNKPVRQSHLYNTLVQFFEHPENQPETTVEILPEQFEIPLSLDVLLAEDNPVNQKFALHLLETWDCNVTVVANGKEALNAVEGKHYDLVLMDLQMPEMDGIEAVGLLREREHRNNIRSENGEALRLTVIAMTAHAMEGDRQRCLDAGMDDYVAKPFSRTEFYETLSKWSGGGKRPSGNTKVQSSVTAVEINWERLYAKCGCDETFVCELIQEFLRETPARLDRIRSASGRMDFSCLHHEAHTLRGACLTLEATEMAALALELEKASKEERHAACREQISLVWNASERLHVLLKQTMQRAAVEH